MRKAGYTYIMTNKRNGTLYTGVTSNLEQRVFQHRNNIYSGFTARYNLYRLVWFEEFDSIDDAISFEKKVKGWLRRKKIALIEKNNPEWKDLLP